MADDEGKQGDIKYYQNQPYDLEVDLNNDEDDTGKGGKQSHKGMSADDEPDVQNYQEIEATAPPIKELPKFDISKFEDLPASPEAKELLSIMKR